MFDPGSHGQLNALETVGMSPVLLSGDSVEKGVLRVEDEQICAIEKPEKRAFLLIRIKFVLRIG